MFADKNITISDQGLKKNYNELFPER